MEELKMHTLKEVMDLLQVTQRTVYTYIKNGDLRAVKFGKYWRISHADLKDFMARGTKPKSN